MSRVAKGLIKIIIEIIVVTILVTSINICLNGMYLLGLPDFDEIQSVRISYPNITNEVKEFSDDYNIELALKLTGFLKYDLFEKTETIFYKGIMPSEKVSDLPVDCNTLAGSVNL